MLPRLSFFNQKKQEAGRSMVVLVRGLGTTGLLLLPHTRAFRHFFLSPYLVG